jgi:two-component system sensor histidine kinase BaeS
MLRSIRNRLILSHILPLIIIVPFLGVALVYVLETQYIFPQLRDDLAGVAGLLAEVTGDQVNLWEDPTYAERILKHLQPRLATRVMLIAPDGRLIASSDPRDQNRLNQIIEVPGLAQAEKGQQVQQTVFSQVFRGRILDVFTPVYNDSQQLVGIIRISYHYDTLPQELLHLRYLIAVVLFVVLLLGSVLGSVLAVSISTPLQRVTQAIYDLARGDRQESLPEAGPDEIQTLVRAFKFLDARLHDLEQARRHLLANLVHEIGRPLGALHSGIQALLRGAKQDPQLLQELLEGMDEETSRLQRLLGDLSHLHEQVLGTLELDRQPIQLAEWLPKVLRPWQEAAYAKRLAWVPAIPEELPVIEADPVRLAQVIGNLTSNAIKYTPPGGTVTISAGGEGRDLIWVRVSDTGPGISREDQEKIFEPFYRGSQKRRIKQGLGLGLSIARDLVIAHGGRIEIDSTPGLGSQFTIWIPRGKPERISEEMAPLEPFS